MRGSSCRCSWAELPGAIEDVQELDLVALGIRGIDGERQQFAVLRYPLVSGGDDPAVGLVHPMHLEGIRARYLGISPERRLPLGKIFRRASGIEFRVVPAVGPGRELQEVRAAMGVDVDG